MATHSSILAWRIPWTEEPTVYGVAKSQAQLKRLPTQTLWESLNLTRSLFRVVFLVFVFFCQGLMALLSALKIFEINVSQLGLTDDHSLFSQTEPQYHEFSWRFLWKFLRNQFLGASLVVQWLGLCNSTAGSAGLIPGQGTKRSHKSLGVGKNKQTKKSPNKRKLQKSQFLPVNHN